MLVKDAANLNPYAALARILTGDAAYRLLLANLDAHALKTMRDAGWDNRAALVWDALPSTCFLETIAVLGFGHEEAATLLGDFARLEADEGITLDEFLIALLPDEESPAPPELAEVPEEVAEEKPTATIKAVPSAIDIVTPTHVIVHIGQADVDRVADLASGREPWPDADCPWMIEVPRDDVCFAAMLLKDDDGKPWFDVFLMNDSGEVVAEHPPSLPLIGTYKFDHAGRALTFELTAPAPAR